MEERSETLRQTLNRKAEELGVTKNEELIKAENKLLDAKRTAQAAYETEKMRAKKQLDDAYKSCPKWLKWICFPTLKTADFAYSQIINVSEFAMSEALDVANAVYQDSRTGIFDFYARGMKLIYNENQMAMDALFLMVNEAQLIFDGARNDLEVLRATAQLELQLIDTLS